MKTVESLFLEATENYSWLSRVHTDHGGETTLVWQHIIARHGENHRSDGNSFVTDLEWSGQDPHAPLTPDDRLSRVEVDEIQVDLP